MLRKGCKLNDKVAAETVRLEDRKIVYPGDSLVYKLQTGLSHTRRVCFQPRTLLQSYGLPPSILKVSKHGEISILNSTSSTWNLRKGVHLADLRAVITHQEALVNKLYTIDDNEYEAYVPRRDVDKSLDFTDDVIIDPDERMDKHTRKEFEMLCKEYKDIIRYDPGTYNGAYGFVKNTIEFTEIPPPNNRCYVPKYSSEQTNRLAEKMDELMALKILVQPEKIGVTPVFTSPSMLVPKTDPEGGWRFVTDFTQLNNYIRKSPTISPGIEETKLSIAGFKYFACIDLSQFYFQNTVDRETSQYLGVVHPYRGTLVYTVSPMGLRNSSELAYERLTRMFGDMQQQRKVCRQADALIVGGKDFPQLLKHLEEVFRRLRLANMTIKPSKLTIAPASTTLFGWEYSNQAWRPGEHRINPLQIAPCPKTVKQLRSWLGASKQLSAGLRDYAKVFKPLEQIVAGKSSIDKIIWTEDMKQCFEKAKQLLSTMEDIFYPLPSDRIRTYSDYSADTMAIGGRMEFTRDLEDGSTKTYHSGFFSACLNSTQQKWLPCEAECLGVKLVLEHFAPLLKESTHQVTHYCDNLPTVLAFQKLKQGKFSSSPRIAAFLTSVNTFNVNIVHKAGKDIALTDYISRNPVECRTKRCQVCSFTKEQVEIGDALVHKVTVSEILEGTYKMPYSQVKTWVTLQKKDPVISKLIKLIEVGQKPEQKRTGGNNTILKNLYNQFTKGNLKINGSGLVTVTQPDDSGTLRNLIVVPSPLFPGLVTSIHLRLQHPTKYQMNKLLGRHFFCPGSSTMVADCVDNCHTCISLKPIPPVLFSESTTQSDKFGTRFSVDIMKRNGQNILFLVEVLTQFCWIKLVNTERSEDILQAIVECIAPYINPEGAIVRSDGAPAFQSLVVNRQDYPVLARLNLHFELGQSHHINKNPYAEMTIKEGHLAINKSAPNSIMDVIQLAEVARALNSKIRSSGYTSWEMLTRRSAVDGDNLSKTDSTIADEKLANKLHSHTPPCVASENPQPGDLVMIGSSKSKLHPRETYIVQGDHVINGNTWVELFKMGDKITSKPQLVKKEDIVTLPTRPQRKAALEARARLKELLPEIRLLARQSVPIHGGDYGKLIKLLELEDDCDSECGELEGDVDAEANDSPLAIQELHDRVDTEGGGLDPGRERVKEEQVLVPGSLLSRAQPLVDPRFVSQIDLNSV